MTFMIRIVETNDTTKIFGYIEQTYHNGVKWNITRMPVLDHTPVDYEREIFKDVPEKGSDRAYLISYRITKYAKLIMSMVDPNQAQKDVILEWVELDFTDVTQVKMNVFHRIRLICERDDTDTSLEYGIKTTATVLP